MKDSSKFLKWEEIDWLPISKANTIEVDTLKPKSRKLMPY